MIPQKHERTISIILDDLPGFDRKAAIRICEFLEDNGYLVHSVTADELCWMDINTLGFMLLIPWAGSLPAVCVSSLKAYSTQGGQIFTLGGPLFNRLIKKVDGKWQEAPFDKKLLDATFTDEVEDIVIEGFVPSYKIYPLYEESTLMTEPGQTVFTSSISLLDKVDIICPSTRPHGLGYNHNRKNRYIPIVQAVGREGRAQGRRGAAAFFMLSDTAGRNESTNGTRPGSVTCTTVGSAAASIGITQQDLLSIPGAGELLLSMIGHMQRGLFLFEGGSHSFVYSHADEVVLGAKILNVSQDFAEVSVRFTAMAEQGIVLERELTVLAMPRNITDIHFSWKDALLWNDINIVVELLQNGKVVDRIQHEAAVLTDRNASLEDFVSVKEDNFYLRGEPWYPAGINYWPFYSPGLENTDYWSGWLDKSFYDPLEVERDLAYLEGMGINCLFTRLDGNVFDRTIPQLQDFLHQCGRHNMKVGLAFPMAMSPLYYNHAAVHKLICQAKLANNPVIFCYDVIWEFGNAFACPKFKHYWDDDWEKWINERYGALNNAEQDWGMSVNRDSRGRVMAPTEDQFTHDGEWRRMVAAYRRFMDDFLSRKWNNALSDMRKVDPNHLITYRQGPTGSYDVSFTATSKHIDFVCPEGYCITHDEDGYYTSCFISRCLDHTSGNKPIIWAEFGKSLTGVRWTSLDWDHERMLPPAGSLENQASYVENFYKMAEDTMVNGMAPWWWAGGFRRVELSDFGIINPEGTLRPSGEIVRHYATILKKPRTRPEPDMWMTVDRDSHAGGYRHFCFHEGRDMYAQAKKEGKWLGVRTEATGTTSENTPLVAVGNVPYSGANPPKYLNSEFNHVTLIDSNGSRYVVQNGGILVVPADTPLFVDMSIGNLQEAEWIAPNNANGDGGVYVVSTMDSQMSVKIPIPHNVPRFKDAVIDGAFLCSGITTSKYISLRMEAENRAFFGEIFNFILKSE